MVALGGVSQVQAVASLVLSEAGIAVADNAEPSLFSPDAFAGPVSTVSPTPPSPSLCASQARWRLAGALALATGGCDGRGPIEEPLNALWDQVSGWGLTGA